MSIEDKILLAELTALYIQNKLTAEQRLKLDELINKYPEAIQILRKNTDGPPPRPSMGIHSVDIENAWLSVEQSIHRKSASKKYAMTKIMAITSTIAACMLIFLGIRYYTNTNDILPDYVVESTNQDYKNDILPGAPSASLVTIPSEEAVSSSTWTKKDNIIKDSILDFRTLTFEDKTLLQLIEVPERATYRIILDDGTNVWLNSKSRISFLPKFNDSERKVKVVGEVYFNVAKDSQRPFIVETDKLTVQAIGTEFNINTYSEIERVLLKEGKLRVSNNQDAYVIIEPGKQVEIKNTKLKISDVNTASISAWKEGFIDFNDKNLQQILQDLKRWYGIEIDCKAVLNPGIKYRGSISKQVALSKVCDVLRDLTGYIFQIENTNLIVKQ